MSNDLRAKYGADAFDTGITMQGAGFEQRLAQRDAIDQHFTRAWLDYQITGLSRRPALDTRTRFLVLIGQYTMAKSQRLLEDTVRAALAAKLSVCEMAEIILQCQVYGGLVTVDPAIETFHKIVEELGLLPELKKSQLPLDGTASKRNRAAEEKTWHKDDVADPRTGLHQCLRNLFEVKRSDNLVCDDRGAPATQIGAVKVAAPKNAGADIDRIGAAARSGQ